MKHKIRETVVRYVIITVACAVYALGFAWCFDPNHISVGGFTGIAQIVNHYLPWAPVGIVTIILNIPIFFVGWRKLGKELLVRALYAMLLSSAFVDVFMSLYEFPPMDPILACLYGGVVIGISIGVMMRQGANTGGSEMAARLLKLKFEGASMGTLLLSVDLVVTVAYALIFRDMTRALYGVIGLYVSSLVMDKVIYGANTAKVVQIISPEYEKITEQLLDLDRGVTLLQGKGAYSGRDKQVILCVVSRSEMVEVKRLVRNIDNEAFLIVMDAHEVLGEGFAAHKENSL